MDPEGYAYEKWKKSKKFDPNRSGVMKVMLAQEQGDFSVDKKAIVAVQKVELQNPGI